MVQDIAPKKLYNEYTPKKLTPKDYIAIFRENKILIKETEAGLALPKQSDLLSVLNILAEPAGQAQYLFRIDQDSYFLFTEDISAAGSAFATASLDAAAKHDPAAARNALIDKDVQAVAYDLTGTRLHWMKLVQIRAQAARELCYAVYTAYHLHQWYQNNRFCGCCAAPMIPDTKERMLYCPKCGNKNYPKIAPAVIVAVTNGDKILLTRYANREYKRYALIAGFTEIGETTEDTVRREVMEEAGVRVKNIRYYKSQPWGIDSNLLLGYFAQLDGSDQISMDINELAAAEWVSREELKDMDDSFSLTREMMRIFYENKL